MAMRTNKILVLTGLSGAGKDTVAEELKKHGFISAVPHTTRPMRDGEVEGNPYHFVSKARYMKMLDEGKFVESNRYLTKFNGVEDWAYYGTSKESLGVDGKLMLTVGVQSALRFKDIVGNLATLIYLHVDDAERERRAKSRGSFDKVEWDNRLAKDVERRRTGAMHWESMDYIIDNTYNALDLTLYNVLKAVK